MIIIAVIAGVVLLGLVLIYNGLIGKKNQVENAFAGMDVQLKKRYDLIPNLISAVKNYMEHERGVLENITRLRAQAMGGDMSTDERVDVDNQITQALGKINVAVENYPDLKASANFVDLQRSLNEVESQISASRRAFNAAVTDFNNGIEMFPGSLLAGPMGLRRKKVFEAPEAERANINVEALFDK